MRHMEGQTRALETCLLEAILFEEKIVCRIASVTRCMRKISLFTSLKPLKIRTQPAFVMPWIASFSSVFFVHWIKTQQKSGPCPFYAFYRFLLMVPSWCCLLEHVFLPSFHSRPLPERTVPRLGECYWCHLQVESQPRSLGFSCAWRLPVTWSRWFPQHTLCSTGTALKVRY